MNELERLRAQFQPSLSYLDPDSILVNGKTLAAHDRQEMLKQLRAGELTEIVFDAKVFAAIYPNRNFYRIRDSDLPRFARTFVQGAFLQDHKETIDTRLGTIIESGLTDDGNGIRHRVRLTSAKGMLAFLEERITRFSISWFSSGATCTICGGDFWDFRVCRHWPGRRYTVKNSDGEEVEKVMEIIWEKPEARETSAVAVAASHDTGLLQAQQLRTAKLNAIEGLEKENEQMPPDATTLEDNRETPQETAPAVNPTDAQADAHSLSSLLLETNRKEEAEAALKAQQQQQALNGQQPGSPPAQRPEVSAQWQAFLIEHKIEQSNLPPSAKRAVRESLAYRGQFGPADVDAAINTQRAALAEAMQHTVIDGIEPIFESQMTTGLDMVENAIAWLFTDPADDDTDNALETPPPSMRSIRQLYYDTTGDWEGHGVFKQAQTKLASANTTTFAGAVLNAVNKRVDRYYRRFTTYRWFEKIVHVMSHDGSWNELDMVTVNGIQMLPIVGEGKPYLEAPAGDVREQLMFTKRGQYVGITLEAIKRNNIERMRHIPVELMQSCVRTRSRQVANIWTRNGKLGNPMTQDNLTLFHASHGNLLTAQLAQASWRQARTMTFKQPVPGSNGERYGLRPQIVLVPEDLRDDTKVMFSIGAGGMQQGRPNTAGTAQEANPYGMADDEDKRAMIVTVPDWEDVNDWGWIVDPMEAMSPVRMSYAQFPRGGMHPSPEIFMANDESSGLLFTNDTMPIKIRDVFGVGVATYLGIGKSNAP